MDNKRIHMLWTQEPATATATTTSTVISAAMIA
jgi:hypothetical protein